MKADLLNDILRDMRVELADEFDQNFSRGGFFEDKWKDKVTGEASTLQGGGRLRRSLVASVRGNSVVFSSSEKYASIHNEGGEITVTPRMRRYFWAKYYEAEKKSASAELYRSLALKRPGDKIEIPKRQYIGDAPQIRKAVEAVVRDNVERHLKEIEQKFKTKI